MAGFFTDESSFSGHASADVNVVVSEDLDGDGDVNVAVDGPLVSTRATSTSTPTSAGPTSV